MLDTLLVAALRGAATGVATGAAEASVHAQGNKAMVDHLRSQAIPRIAVWLGVSVWALVRAKNLITGEGRDIAFREMTLSTATQAAGVAIALAAAGLCVLAAWRTYTRERKPPPSGTLWFPGYRMPLFGEWLLAIVGGLLIVAALYGYSTIPESIAAGHDERFRAYESASAMPALIFGSVMGGIGYLCMVVRRSRWELVTGQPLLRRSVAAFSRLKPMGDKVALQWEGYWVGNGVMRRQVAWVLRGVVRKGKAFEIAFAPLAATQQQRGAIAEGWRQVIWATGTIAITGIDVGPALA